MILLSFDARSGLGFTFGSSPVANSSRYFETRSVSMWARTFATSESFHLAVMMMRSGVLIPFHTVASASAPCSGSIVVADPFGFEGLLAGGVSLLVVLVDGVEDAFCFAFGSAV